MKRIAFLGLGAMGSRMAQSLIDGGHTLVVWNRDAAKALALAERGAAIASSPRAAAAGADVVISMVRDDDASRSVWLDGEHGALGGMAKHAVAIECSTVSVDWVNALAAQAIARGVAFLDAPVAGSLPQAQARALIFMVGGAAETVAEVEPLLRAMGGAVHHAGPNGAGAAVKLAVNAMFGAQVAALAELIGALRAAGVDPAKAAEILAATPVGSPAAKGAAASMLAGDFTAMFPVRLVEKDFGYVEKLGGRRASAMPIAHATRTVLGAAIEAGLGDLNLTSLVALYAPGSAAVAKAA